MDLEAVYVYSRAKNGLGVAEEGYSGWGGGESIFLNWFMGEVILMGL